MRNERMRLWRALTAGAAGCLFLLAAPGVLAAEPGTISSFSQLLNLSKEAVQEGRPMRVRAAVLCYDAGWNQLYLHDGNRAVYFDPKLFFAEPPLGQFVDVVGRTALKQDKTSLADGRFEPVADPSELVWPPPVKLNLNQLARESGQWIETTGWVRVVDTSRGRLGMVLREGNQDCLIYVMGPIRTRNPKRFLDCQVRVRGINDSKSARGRLESASLMVPSVNSIAVLERPAPRSPESQVSSIGNLLNRELGRWTNNRVRVNGLISAYTPGSSITIKDPTGTIQASIIQITPANLETRVNLWGFLSVTRNGPVLKDAFFEVHNEPAGSAALARRPAAATANTNRVLMSVMDVLRLSKEEAAQHIPVELEGVMTYADNAWKVGFVQDASGGVFVNLPQEQIRAGDRVKLTAVTGGGGFAPELRDATLVVAGRTNLPAPVKLDLREVSGGTWDAQWVQLEGVVRRVQEEEGHWHLSFMTRQGPFKAVLPNETGLPKPAHLMDAVVQVAGACGAVMNSRGQLSGITLHVPSLDQIEIVSSAPSDAFAAGAIPIATVAKFDHERLAGRRAKISGVITLLAQPNWVFVQDASGGLGVQVEDFGQLRQGDQVDVLGFPALGEFSPHLADAELRVTGKSRLPSPRTATAEGILTQGVHDGLLVSLQARLVQDVPRSANPQLILQDGPVVFVARSESGASGSRFADLKAGSLLRLTGVCSIQASETREPKAFRLHLSDPGSVTVLESPSWWTKRRTLTLAAGLTLAIGAALVWVALLRAQVRRQTNEIRKKLRERRAFAESLARERTLLATLIDHLPDIVFVKDRGGRYLLTNRQHSIFHEATHEKAFIGKTSAEVFGDAAIGTCMATDRQVLETGRPILDIDQVWPDAAGNPRNLLTSKVPLLNGSGQLIGLVGISRDVTDRRRAEAELARAQNRLLESSRMAGMAEVATSVLHNVGNVLNSINVSATLLVDLARHSKTGRVAQVATLFDEHSADLAAFLTADPRGRHAPAFLKQLGEHLAAEQAAIVREAELVVKNVEHVKTIISMQQNYAKVSGLAETVNLQDLLEDALQLSAAAFERHHVRLTREYDACIPEITTEKHKVFQILVNIIRNAHSACKESGREDKQIAVRIRHRCGRIQVEVTDNGIGIPERNLTRIFSHGFTTRKNGHGFGLHSGALAARELGGTLIAHSDGEGRGATFVLDLPVNPVAREAVAA